MRKIIFISLSLSFLFSCSEKAKESFTFSDLIPSIFVSSSSSAKVASPAEYISFIENEENGLRVTKEIERIRFTLQYKPLDLAVLSELKGKSKDEKLFRKTRKEFEGMQYFNFRVESSTGPDLLKFDGTIDDGTKMNYLAFEMQKDLFLVDGLDTLPCRIFHYERTYNIAPYSDFILAFEESAKNNKHDKTLIFEDRLFNTGTIKLKIRREDILNVPTLIINKNESES